MRCPHLGRQRSSPGTTIQFQFQQSNSNSLSQSSSLLPLQATRPRKNRPRGQQQQQGSKKNSCWAGFTPFLNSVLRCGSSQKLPEGGIEPSSLPGLPGNQQKQPLYASWPRGILEKPIEGAGRQLAGSRKPPKAPFSPPTSRAPEATTPPPLMLAI
jgi:hypothetical protein